MAAAPVAVDKGTVLEVTLTLPAGRVKLFFGRAKTEGWINARDDHLPFVSGVAGLSVLNKKNEGRCVRDCNGREVP